VAVPDRRVTPASIAAVLARRCCPRSAIVVDEAVSSGRAFDRATRARAAARLAHRHGRLHRLCACPRRVGAALAAPGRRVIALDGRRQRDVHLAGAVDAWRARAWT
jgi:acetolactate synthase-1/2/3 large subunit